MRQRAAIGISQLLSYLCLNRFCQQPAFVIAGLIKNLRPVLRRTVDIAVAMQADKNICLRLFTQGYALRQILGFAVSQGSIALSCHTYIGTGRTAIFCQGFCYSQIYVLFYALLANHTGIIAPMTGIYDNGLAKQSGGHGRFYLSPAAYAQQRNYH